MAETSRFLLFPPDFDGEGSTRIVIKLRFPEYFFMIKKNYIRLALLGLLLELYGSIERGW